MDAGAQNVGGREEWGNPNTPKYFDYMLSYSPIDNVREQRYPHILITAGLFDPRVAYWSDSPPAVCRSWLSQAGWMSSSDTIIISTARAM